jgi:predicted dehydrogenase
MTGPANGRLRFGLIGAGAIAQTYAPAFEQCETARVVAVADTRREAAGALAERLKCPAFGSYQELGEGAQLDAVVISTPPDHHPEIAIHFLRRGVHVLCEKPFSLDSGSARAMVEAAEASGALLTMASKFRYVDDVVKAKSLLASGALGEVVLFENAFTSRVDMSARWNSDPRVSGGGVLVDNGTHSVDIMRYLLGSIAELQVVEGRRIQGLKVDETVHVHARSADGVDGSIDLSWSINKELDRYISLYGSGGTVVVGWKESKFRPATSREWIPIGRGYDKFQAFRSQIDNFSRAVAGKEPLLITTADAIASVEVIEAARVSLAENRWVPVKANGHGGRS